jgi:Domain of unknown function (DUF1963)
MTDWDAHRQEAVGRALEAGFGARDAQLIARLCRPAASLRVATRSEAPVGTTKVGGLPDLPRTVDWPRGAWGPMLFCGQVNTADVEFLHGVDGWAPSAGLLSFFADKEPDGWDVEAGRVLLLATRELERREAPPDRAGSSWFVEAPLEAVPVLSPPMETLRDAELEHDLGADDWAAWGSLFTSLGCGDPSITAGHHQLFGNAWAIGDLDPIWAGAIKLMTPEEDEEEDEDEARRFRLLAQFTTDQEANLEIADAGAIYFVIRADDLAANRYDRVCAHVDSC